MKILIDEKINNHYSIALAGNSLGIDFLVLNQAISTFDAFDKFMPDIVVYKEKTRAIEKCLNQNPGILSLEYKDPPMFFDVMDPIGNNNPKYATDIIYIHTGTELPKEIYALCYKNYRIKIFGNYVRLAQYCGPFPGNDVICSAKVAIDSGILPKFIRQKIFTISKYDYPVPTPKYDNQAELEFLINQSLSSPDRCKTNVEMIYKECVKYSSFHILQKMLEGLKIQCKIPNEELL